MVRSKKVVLDFIDAINAHDVERIAALLADDHIFVDAYGNQETREEMLTGWPGYFAWFPDYHIDVEQVLHDGDTIVVLGFASGTYSKADTPDGHWRLPAAWKAVVGDGSLTRWQVYCDSKIPFETMRA